jgi:hypothetical protein
MGFSWIPSACNSPINQVRGAAMDGGGGGGAQRGVFSSLKRQMHAAHGRVARQNPLVTTK